MLILASASPRRQELLGIITPDFHIEVRDTDESLPKDTTPDIAVCILALRKAKAVAAEFPNDTIIGADTVVALNGELLGKPRDASHAKEMLRKLSGARHQVYTGVALVYPGGETVFFESTQVDFVSMTYKQIDDYIETGEPFDKAGAYGIQGFGALYVSGIQGDYYTVMGLPVSRLAKELSLLPHNN